MTRAQWRAMIAHLEAAYPEEGCGILLGEQHSALRVVRAVRPTPNAWEDAATRRSRFTIAPEDFVRAAHEAEQHGWDVLGFFHSHPDHPPVPSETDRALAWPATVIVIVSLRAGRAAETRAWMLNDAGQIAAVPLDMREA